MARLQIDFPDELRTVPGQWSGSHDPKDEQREERADELADGPTDQARPLVERWYRTWAGKSPQ